MSLIAWYPLDGNTEDYTVNQNNGTPTDITYTNGKIGQAGVFNGTSSVVSSNSIGPLNEVNISFWFKWTDYGTANTQFVIAGSAETMEVHTGGSAGINGLRFIINTHTASTLDILNAIPDAGWNHYSINYYSGFVKVFRNGIEIASRTHIVATAIPANIINIGRRNNNSLFLNGLINDVRIYDHALSQREITEISQAKVLEYNFNNFQEPTTNLIKNVVDMTFESTAGLHIYDSSVITDSTFKYNGHNTYKIDPGIVTSGFNITSDIYIPGGTIVNMSYYVYIPSNQVMTRSWEIHRHMLPDGICLGGSCHHYTSIDYTNRTWDNNSPKDVWFRRDITVQAHDDDLAVNGYLARMFAYSSGTADDGYFYITEPQIESKAYPTEFTDSSRIGLVYDSSGYKRNGILTNSFYSIDSILGSGSRDFSGSSEYLDLSSQIVLENELTYSF